MGREREEEEQEEEEEEVGMKGQQLVLKRSYQVCDIYMLGAKYGFAQSMDCAAQIMDPYFAREIHGLHVNIHVIFIFIFIVFCFLFFLSVHVHGLHKPGS